MRFANNGVTTSAFTVERSVTISSVREGKGGASRTTDLSEDALKSRGTAQRRTRRFRAG